MKPKIVKLDSGLIEDEFFEDMNMISIRSDKPGYSICGIINDCLGYNFKRNDIDVSFNFTNSKRASVSLFETIIEPIDQSITFPVYKHCSPYNDENCIFIYSNKSNGFTLLDELVGTDFILLYSAKIYDGTTQNLMNLLPKINDIIWTKEVDIASLKKKKNLII